MSDKQVRAQYTREFKPGGGSAGASWPGDCGGGQGAGHSQSQSGQLGATVIPRESWTTLAAPTRRPKSRPSRWRLPGAPRMLSPSHGARHRKKAAAYFAQDTLRGTPGLTK